MFDKRKLVYAALPFVLGACSVVMEATRPDPVDLSTVVVGESRTQVMGTLGAPLSSTVDSTNHQSCDIYKMYTQGPGDFGKATIAATEAVADVFTLGLAEVITTPTEAVTRNGKHTVTVCYTADRLASVHDGGAQ